MAADDRYTISGSGGVLKNRLGLTTSQDVDVAMNESASRRWSVMIRESIPDQIDLDYLTSIHRRLLSPVLTWAGEMRRFGDEVIADGTGIVYARSEFYRGGLTDVFGQLESKDYLRDLEARKFADLLAATITIHQKPLHLRDSSYSSRTRNSNVKPGMKTS